MTTISDDVKDLEYPEHEKLGKINTKSQAIGEFMEWLQTEKGVRLAHYPETKPDELWPWHVPTEKLLAEFFGIDLKKLEEEKQDMLDKFRKVIAPKYEVGTKVMAISHAADGKVYVFGRGTYIGDKDPADPSYPTPTGAFMGANNPCIKLDNGQHVWGCECWWGPEDVMMQKFGGREEVAIDIDKRREEVRAQRNKEE